METPRVAFVAHSCYFDATNGAAVASRALIRALAAYDLAVEVLSGAMLDLDREVEPARWLAERGLVAEEFPKGAQAVATFDLHANLPSHFRLTVDGFPITIHRSPSTRPHEPGEAECGEFISLLDSLLDRFRPDMLIGYGGNSIARATFARARSREIATVFALHNFLYNESAFFADVDAILIPSQFAADFYREAHGLASTALPNIVDPRRIKPERFEPRYVTFVNPTPEKGVYAFARIADELGRRRPDIPLLVVEARGTERTLADCGLDLRARGNVNLMAHTADPRRFWGVTRVCLVPSLWWESQSLVAAEAMTNGIPVIASDRGALPETLGQGGIVLPLPDRLTPVTKLLPTAEEVAPWVEAIIRLWDDREWYQEQRRRALAEARRWEPEVLVPQYVRFFEGLKPGFRPTASTPRRSKAVVLVPHLGGIEPECEQSLLRLEREGVRVVRYGGSSAIDIARNQLASNALHDGAEALLFIDADIGFAPADALRLLARPEPVVAGVYAKKGRRELACQFAEDVDEVAFGHPLGLYPLKYVATGFLRIRAEVLRRMIAELALPLCNTHWGKGEWPFFQPTIVPDPGGPHYLGEDWSFSHRLGLIGVTPLADTSIRLWHFGRYAYGWEDAIAELPRHPNFTFRP